MILSNLSIQLNEQLGLIALAVISSLIIGFILGRLSKRNKNSTNFNLNDSEIDLDDDISKIRATKTFERGGKETVKTFFEDKSNALNFNRLGISSFETKDNLKVIKGIGKEIETKLNEIGIFSFEQISNFNNNDIVKITESLKFFPGRIERDDWVGQAFKILNHHSS